MIVVGTFIANEHVADGIGVALIAGSFDLCQIVWAGPITLCPLDQFEEGTEVHVHPKLYERIHTAVAKLETGVPDERTR